MSMVTATPGRFTDGPVGFMLDSMDRSDTSAPTLTSLCARAVALRFKPGSKTRQQYDKLISRDLPPEWTMEPVTGLDRDKFGTLMERLRTSVVRAGDTTRIYNISRFGLELYCVLQQTGDEKVDAAVNPVIPVWVAGRKGRTVGAVMTEAGIGAGMGVTASNGIGMMGGAALSKIGSIKGPPGSAARQIPPFQTATLYITTAHLAAIPALGGQVVWLITRSDVRDVVRKPHIQILRRFRMEFADGSSAEFFTAGRETIPHLQSLLWSGGKG